MALGRQRDRQAEMLVAWSGMPRSPGHVFYDRLQAGLVGASFDAFVEGQCVAYYAAHRGRPSLPPGRHFRMLLVGYFEGIDSERGLEWRCADSLSLREFLRLGEREPVPDHSWLSRTRARLPLEVHDAAFTWVLQRLAERGLVKGERIGVDASTMEANAALRAIVRRDTGEGYRDMPARMARESGIETPTAADLVRLDRARKGKRLSNTEWESPTGPQARIAKLKGLGHCPKPGRIWPTSPSMRWTSTPVRWSRPRCAWLARATPRPCQAPWRARPGISPWSRRPPAPRRPPSWWPTRAIIRGRC
jgi:transposase